MKRTRVEKTGGWGGERVIKKKGGVNERSENQMGGREMERLIERDVGRKDRVK